MMIEMVLKAGEKSRKNLQEFGITPAMIANDYTGTIESARPHVWDLLIGRCMGMMPEAIRARGASPGVTAYIIRRIHTRDGLLSYFYENREMIDRTIHDTIHSCKDLDAVAEAAGDAIPRVISDGYAAKKLIPEVPK